MNLNEQFQVIIVSILFGIIFMIFYEFVNKLTYNKKGKIIRFIIELIYFLFMSLLFFIILLYINDAVFNIFIILFLFIGIIIYLLLFQIYFQKLYAFIFSFLKNKYNKVINPIKEKFAIINKKKKVKKHEKNKRSKKNNNSKE